MFPLFLTAGPNEVLVVSGVGHSKPAMVTGGRIIVISGLQKWWRMNLNVMTLVVSSPGVYTLNGVPLKVTGVAQVKIASTPTELLELACENFLSKSPDEIKHLVQETLEGHQRGIMGTMTVEEIYKNRKLFNERVFAVASKDLLGMGVTVMSYTIKDLTDDYGYLQGLGKARTAEVMRDARIGEASAKMESTIKEAQGAEELARHHYSNKVQTAEAERNYKLQKYSFDKEVNAEKAISDLAFQLQECITRQKIREEEIETQVVERAKKVEIAEEELKRKRKQLEASIMQVADAEKYRMERIAEAERKKKVIEAEAEAEAIRLRAEAERDATLALSKAEFEQMTSKAQAWNEYGKAAILQEYLNILPQMVKKIGNSMSQVKKIKMLSSGSSDVGAYKLTNEVSEIVESIPVFVQDMTGVQFSKKFGAMMQNKSSPVAIK